MDHINCQTSQCSPQIYQIQLYVHVKIEDKTQYEII